MVGDRVVGLHRRPQRAVAGGPEHLGVLPDGETLVVRLGDAGAVRDDDRADQLTEPLLEILDDIGVGHPVVLAPPDRDQGALDQVAGLQAPPLPHPEGGLEHIPGVTGVRRAGRGRHQELVGGHQHGGDDRLGVTGVDHRPVVGVGDDPEAALDEQGSALGGAEHPVRFGEPGRAAQQVQVVGDRTDVGPRVERRRRVRQHGVEAHAGEAGPAGVTGEVGLLVRIDGEHPQPATGQLGGDLKGQGGLAHPTLVGGDRQDLHHRSCCDVTGPVTEPRECARNRTLKRRAAPERRSVDTTVTASRVSTRGRG